MCPKPKTMAPQNKAEKVGFGKEHQVSAFKPERSEDAKNEEREVKRGKIEKKQTKKTASNFDRCCFGEWSRTLKRTDAT